MAESVAICVPEQSPAVSAVRETMKFKNGDVSLDTAVESILESGRGFTMPNADLLIKAAMDTPW